MTGITFWDEFEPYYNGDDKCPKCGAMYCTDAVHNIEPHEHPHASWDVRCLGCGYTAKLREFMDCFRTEVKKAVAEAALAGKLFKGEA